VLLGAGGLAFGFPVLGAFALGLGLFVTAFFRNPTREIPNAERDVVSPADGRVIALDEVELPGGEKGLRIGIFLSVFDVHVNRAPVAGRVVAIERSGNAFLAAFNPEAGPATCARPPRPQEPGGADHRLIAAHRLPRPGRRVAGAVRATG
jgi:phosphatidylserine decarboxylase